MPFIPTGNPFARLTFVESDGGTPIGDVVIELFEGRSPAAVERFITLAENAVNPDGTLDPAGVPFWTDVAVHRIIDGFVIQTGDKENGDGTGGSPLGDFEGETHADLRFAGTGMVAWANGGGPTNDSQFFITLDETNHLDGLHPVIGQLVSGQAVVDAVVAREPDLPNDPPLLQSVTITDSPQDATLTLIPVNGFGGTANVTVSLDDGTSVTQDTFAVTVRGIDDPGDLAVPAGTSDGFTAVLHEEPGVNSTLAAAVDLDTATVAVDTATNGVTLTTPAGYTGFYRVDLTAAPAIPRLNPAEQSFAVFAQEAGDPAALGWVPTSKRVVGNEGGTLFGRAFAGRWEGDRLYVSNGEGGLEIWDVADPGAPTRLGTFDTKGQVRDVVVVGDNAYLAATFAGVISLDVSDPAHIRQLDVLPTTSAAVALAVHDGALFVAGFAAGLIAVDITDPADLAVLDTLVDLAPDANLAPLGIAAGDGVAWLADQGGRLVAVDITDPADLDRIDVINAGGQPFGIAYDDARVYLTDQSAGGGLIVYDVTDPAAAGELGRVTLAGGAFQVTVSAGMALAGGASDSTFTFIDLSDPADPTVLYAFDAPFVATRPDIDGRRAALASFGSGVALLGLPNRAPTVAVPALDIVLNGNEVDVAADLSGVFADADLPLGDTLTLTVTGSTDPTVGAVIVDGTRLELDFVPFVATTSTVTIRATDDSGAFVEDAFTVTVNGHDPVVVAPIGDFPVDAGSDPLLFDLTTVFDDVDVAFGDALTFAVAANSNPGLVDGAILGDADLALSVPILGNGAATITITATDSVGRSAEDTFTVTVAPANQLGEFDATRRLTLAVGGVDVTFTLKGDGLGRVLDAEGGMIDVVLSDTAATSAVTIKGGDLIVHNVEIDGPLKSFTAKTADLMGDFTSGPAGSIVLDDVVGPAVMTIGAALGQRDTLSLTFDRVQDLVIDALMPIKQLKVTQWLDSDAIADVVSAFWLGKLAVLGQRGTVPGNFQAGLVLSGAGATSTTLGSAKIAGDLGWGVAQTVVIWNITGDAGTIDASKGTIAGWELVMHSAVKSLKLGRVLSADVTVGDADGAGRRGDIGTLSATQWDIGRILTGSVKTMTTRADPRTTGGDGGMRADVELTGSANPRVRQTLGSGRFGGRLDVGAWAVSGPTGKLSADAIGPDWVANFDGDVSGVAVKGNASGDLTARALGAFTVKGDYTNASLRLTLPVDPADTRARFKALGKLAVKGRMDNVDVRSAGHVGRIDTGLLWHTTIFAGVDDAVAGLPDPATDFTAIARIDSVKVKGARDEAVWFADSRVAASHVGKATLAHALTPNGGVAFGVAANTFSSMSYKDDVLNIRARRLEDLAGAGVDDLVFRIV